LEQIVSIEEQERGAARQGDRGGVPHLHL